MEIDFQEDDSDVEQQPGNGSENENEDEALTAELRRREAEDEEIQRHLHQDEAEDANLSAIINDGVVGGDGTATNGTLTRNGGEAVGEMDFISDNGGSGDPQNGEGGESGEEDEEDDEEDEEDDIQITIGDFSKASLANVASGLEQRNLNLNLNKGGRQFGTATGVSGAAKSKSSLDLDAVGDYKDVPIFDLNLDTLEDKPWRKPGADITDYFNYGFNEDTWKVYCERQKKIRALNAGNAFDINNVLNLSTLPMKTLPDGTMLMAPPILSTDKAMPHPSVNENSKYNSSGSIVINTNKKPGPPPGRKTSGTIDVIGNSGNQGPPTLMLTPMLQSRDHNSDGPSRDGPQLSLVPQPNTSMGNLKENNFISVIGQRGGPPPLPFPPGLSLPPPFLPPDFPPGLRPMGILPPPIGPNGQPLPFLPPDGFNLNHPRFPPTHGGGILPHPDRPPFTDDFNLDGSRRSRDRHHDRDRHSSRDRDLSYGSGSGSRDSRRGGGGSSSYRDYDDGSSGNSRNARRGGGGGGDHYRDSRDYERDREPRNRDRSRERSTERRSSRDKDYDLTSTLLSIPPPPPPANAVAPPQPTVATTSSSSSSSRNEASSVKTSDASSSGARRHRDRNEKDRKEKDTKVERSEKESKGEHKEKSDGHKSDRHRGSDKESRSESKDASSKKSKHDSHDERKHSRHGTSSSKSSSSKTKKSSRHSSKDKGRKDD